jgi:serine/threonine protein kinase
VSSPDPFGLIGQVLDGQFRVDQQVGEGGFSVVYRGHHLGLDEPIAIKCLKLPAALGSALVDSFVRRFRDESRLLYRLSQGHLAIVRSIASGTTMAPATSALVPYMVLEWLEGRSLAADFDVRKESGLRGRSLEETVHLLDNAVQGLAYAHAQGVVHRDINPGNLFITQSRNRSPHLKVLDFGVAKIVSDHALEMGPRAATIGQIRIFAPAYGAPEQFDDNVGRVGPWTDVYALALVALEMLTDRCVFDGDNIGQYAILALDAHRRPTPRSMGVAVGDEVEALFARAVSIAPSDRPQDAGEFWGMLKNAIRRDAESGKRSHAGVGSAESFGRLSPIRVPTGTILGTAPPLVDVPRVGSSPPPPAPLGVTVRTPQPNFGRTVRMSSAPVRASDVPPEAVVRGSRPPGGRSLGETVALSRSLGDTVALPRSASETLALTPVPSPFVEGRPGSVPTIPLARVPNFPSGSFTASGAGQGADDSDEPPSKLPLPVSSRRWPFVSLGLVVVAVGGLLVGRKIIAKDHVAPASSSPPVALTAPEREAGKPAAAPAAASTGAAPAVLPTLPATDLPSALGSPAEGVTARGPERRPKDTRGGPSEPRAADPRPQDPPRSAAGIGRTPPPAADSPPAPAAKAGAPAASPTPAEPPSGPRGFNQAAAVSALDLIDGILASCRHEGGKSGAGHVAVTFGSAGSVTTVAVDQPPFSGTQEGDCVASRFRTAKIAPFEGPATTIDYTFHLPK